MLELLLSAGMPKSVKAEIKLVIVRGFLPMQYVLLLKQGHKVAKECSQCGMIILDFLTQLRAIVNGL